MRLNDLRSLMRTVLLTMIGLSIHLLVTGQNYPIQGHVKKTNGEPLIGVNVVIKGTTIQTFTDLDGFFELSPADQVVVLQFSYIGYASREIKVRGNQLLNVIMLDNNESPENNYSIGYGTVQKGISTGAIEEYRPNDINRSGSTSVQGMSIGQFAGLRVISDGGAPGTGYSMTIRGGSSLYGSNEPLIILDGMPLSNDGLNGLSNSLYMIQPQDVEKITVLKDAGATAIYGARGSNGVIIIETKKGFNSEKPVVNYNGNVSVGKIGKTKNVLSSEEFRHRANNVYQGNDDILSNLGSADTDWQKEIYQSAVSTDHHVSVAGGVDFLPYRVSMGYTGQEGILKTSKANRFTLGANINPSFFDDHLKVNIGLKYMNAKTTFADQNAIKAAVYMDPTQPVYTSSGNFRQWNIYDNNGNSIFNPNATPNPVSLLELADDKGSANQFQFIASADYKFHFAPALKYHIEIGFDTANGDREYTLSPAHPYYNTNYYSGIDLQPENRKNIYFNTYLEFSKQFKRNKLEIMVGYEWQKFERTYPENITNYFAQQGYDTSKLYVAYYNGESTNHNVSGFGRFRYSLQSKYTLDLNVRYDKNSALHVGSYENSDPFFSAGFSWNIKEERLFRHNDAISALKLRMNAGISGNKDVKRYNYSSGYLLDKGSPNYMFDQDVYPGISSGYTPLYRYNYTEKSRSRNTGDYNENTRAFNGGLEIGFAKDRVNITADYFYKRSVNLSGPLYFNSNWNNAIYNYWQGYDYYYYMRRSDRKLVYHGIDGTFKAQPIVSKNFTWNLLYNACFFIDGSGSIRGVYNEHIGPEYLSDNRGAIRIDSYYDAYSLGYESAIPRMTMSLYSGFNIWNFDLSIMLRFNSYNYIYDRILDEQADMGVYNYWSNGSFTNRLKEMDYFYYYPNYYDNDLTYDYRETIKEGSFLRCDNITLGYTFGNHWNVIKGGRVYASVQNPFIILRAFEHNKPDLTDPEIGFHTDLESGVKLPGIDTGTRYPRPITGIIGVSLTF